VELVPKIAPPPGFTFNQHLAVANQPPLFQGGPRPMFGSVLNARDAIVPARAD
jgi:hypothetical protein